MIRVLHIVTTMNRGGLETMIMNYYRNIDRDNLQFDFLVHTNEISSYEDEIQRLGGKIFRISKLIPWSNNYQNELKIFFKEHQEYKIIHVHQDCLSAVALKVAKNCGISVRVAHSHSSSAVKNIKYPIKWYYMRKIPKYATDLFACGKAAGDWMFNGASYRIMPNAIDMKKFQYSDEKRKKIKEEFGLKDELVIGHVGNFTPAKNHEYLLRIFNEILKKKSESKLLLVGAGSGREKIENLASELGMKDSVIFAGLRTDVEWVMQAMDIFVFPSIYEGLPVTLIEAQAAGLPCIISDGVSPECKITEKLVEVKKLSDSPDGWAEFILKTAEKNTLNIRKSQIKKIQQEIKSYNYDILEAAEKLQEFYIQQSN